MLEVSELFLMADLKAEVEKLSIKIISENNVKRLCRGADDYGCKKLTTACADFMVKNGICLDGEEVKQMAAVTAACMVAYREELEASKGKDMALEASKKALTTCQKELEFSKQSLEATKCALGATKLALEASKQALKASEEGRGRRHSEAILPPSCGNPYMRQRHM